jgi:hypothetical protein
MVDIVVGHALQVKRQLHGESIYDFIEVPLPSPGCVHQKKFRR